MSMAMGLFHCKIFVKVFVKRNGANDSIDLTDNAGQEASDIPNVPSAMV